MASEGKAECLLGLGFLQAEQLSETTFFSSPDVPEEDANEHILMLQNCQMLSKKANRMPSHPRGSSLMGVPTAISYVAREFVTNGTQTSLKDFHKYLLKFLHCP